MTPSTIERPSAVNARMPPSSTPETRLLSASAHSNNHDLRHGFSLSGRTVSSSLRAERSNLEIVTSLDLQPACTKTSYVTTAGLLRSARNDATLVHLSGDRKQERAGRRGLGPDDHRLAALPLQRDDRELRGMVLVELD